MDFPHGVMVTLRSVTTTTDDNGDATTATVESQWGPCAVAPRYAAEQADPRSTPVIVGKVVYGPSVAIDSDDQLVIDGEAWQVDGLPGEWVSPFTGWAPGIEVPVKRAGVA
jgi:hypothetical protein